MAILKPGSTAPDFQLYSTPDQKVRLSDCRGSKLILAFYPADWSPVCGDELGLFNEVMPIFRKLGAELLGISVDNIWSHIAFTESRKFRFQLLSDFEPKGEVSRKYGVYRDTDGTSERALFIIGENGTVQWSYLSPVGLNPGADGLIDALEELEASKKPGLKETGPKEKRKESA